MNKAVFDAATLADAIGKAARVAPSKGSAYDKAAGILIDLNSTTQVATIRATNFDLTYEHRITVQEIKGTHARWRIPSALFSGLLSNLPLGAGTTVTFHDRGDGAIRITSGTTVVKIHTLDADEFPALPVVDRSKVSESQDFAAKIAQVSWACAKDNSALSGIRIDGESLVSCDRNSAAIAPCKIPLLTPVTVPLYLLTPILKTATDVRVGADDHNFFIVLDAESEATGRLIEGEYPNVKALLRDNFSGYAMVPRTAFVETVNRMMVIARAERLPSITIEFNIGLIRQMVLDLDVPEIGRIQDRIDVGGDYPDDFKVKITPQGLVSAIENARSDTVRLDFGNKDDPSKGPLSSIRVSDDDGYEALVMPRRT